MKNPNANFKRLYRQGKPVYTYADVTIYNKKLNQTETKYLRPQNFRASGNSYSQSGNASCPIGNVLSKSVTLTFSNVHREWADYDWSTATIELKSAEKENNTYYTLDEGKFYVNHVRYIQNAVEVTAYDMIQFTNIERVLRNQIPGGGKEYDTIRDYFKDLCDNVLASRMGISLSSSQHLYTDRSLNVNGMNFALAEIAPSNDKKTTLRDILGYMAQIAGGNVVVARKNIYPYYAIDIVPLVLLPEFNVWSAGRIGENVEDVYDAGEFGQTVTDVYGGSDMSNIDYALLDNYTTPPTVEYSDTVFTGISLEYPVKNTTTNGKVSVGTDTNLLKLYNPLLESDADSQADQNTRIALINYIKSNICNKPIRPFSGTFKNNPLLEFGDNVLIMDAFGDIYQSYIAEHDYHYLSGSDINNKIRTQAQNNNQFYN